MSYAECCGKNKYQITTSFIQRQKKNKIWILSARTSFSFTKKMEVKRNVKQFSVILSPTYDLVFADH